MTHVFLIINCLQATVIRALSNVRYVFHINWAKEVAFQYLPITPLAMSITVGINCPSKPQNKLMLRANF